LSLELFGTSLPLPDFPRLESLRGLGLSDWAGYADRLEELFAYRNTFYHLDPKFDIAAEHPKEHGRYDFVIASEVFEHVRPPVERALAEARRLLAPGGRLVLTVPYSLDERTLERYPSLNRFTVAEIDGTAVLVNRRDDGTLEAFEGLVFHRGPRSVDASLEVRVFSRSGLEQALHDAGFTDVTFYGEPCLRYGIVHHEWSQPVVARMEPGAVAPAYVGEMVRRLGSLRSQSRKANDSRWSRLGRRLGLGPTINLDGKIED
jgi:SAM-dependent methyltransferase